jgi:hypothetical protein
MLQPLAVGNATTDPYGALTSRDLVYSMQQIGHKTETTQGQAAGPAGRERRTMEGNRVISYFEKERARIDALLAGADAARWASARRTDGWTALEVLGHMVSATPQFLEVARRALAGEPPLEGAVDVATFNERERTRRGPRNLAGLRGDWEALAARVLAFLEQVPPEGWGTPATMTWGPGSTVEEILGAATYHLRTHRAELEALLRA